MFEPFTSHPEPVHLPTTRGDVPRSRGAAAPCSCSRTAARPAPSSPPRRICRRRPARTSPAPSWTSRPPAPAEEAPGMLTPPAAAKRRQHADPFGEATCGCEDGQNSAEFGRSLAHVWSVPAQSGQHGQFVCRIWANPAQNIRNRSKFGRPRAKVGSHSRVCPEFSHTWPQIPSISTGLWPLLSQIRSRNRPMWETLAKKLHLPSSRNAS